MSNKVFSRSILLTILLLLFVVMNCGEREHSNPFDPDFSGETGGIPTTGMVRLPAAMGKSGFTIHAGLKEGSINGGTYAINLRENTVQAIMVTNGSEQPVLMSINVTRQTAAPDTLDARSTAESLVFLYPFICTSNLEQAAELKTLIRSLPSFTALTQSIQNQLDQGTFSITDTNPALTPVLEIVFSELTEALTRESMSRYNNLKQLGGDTPNPSFEINGLKVIDNKLAGQELSFRLANRAKRWISVYIDKSTDGSGYSSDGAAADLIPSPDISVYSIVSQRNLMPSAYSKPLSTDVAGCKSVAVRCYGLGLLPGEQNPPFERYIAPVTMTAVFDMLIPIFEVLSGTSLSVELRGAPVRHPFYKLVEKIAEEILADIAKKAQLIRWSHEGKIVEIVVDIAKTGLLTAAENPSYITEIIAQTVGVSIARTVVNNWLFPIRVVNAVFTAYNLGATIAYILATEAVTTFTFTTESTDPMVEVQGQIKDYSSGENVADAAITVRDANGMHVTSVISDQSGRYLFTTKTGDITMRIAAAGYTTVEQTLNIPANTLFQTPPLFTAPVTYLSRFTLINGTIMGIVRDATNLLPLANVLVTLRYGINDPMKPVVSTTVSQTDGSFSFSDLPSGTYTAFFTRSDYISDFLVVNIVGGVVTSSFYMNLSPDIRTDGGFRIVLTWGENPRDLDSHVITPMIEGARYHIYFGAKGELVAPPYVNLDVDDVTSFGPETTTIARTLPGTYYYCVHHYAGVGALRTSGAIVNLYGSSGFIRSFNVPLSGEGDWWNLFALDGATGALTLINRIEQYPPARAATGMPGMLKLPAKVLEAGFPVCLMEN